MCKKVVEKDEKRLSSHSSALNNNILDALNMPLPSFFTGFLYPFYFGLAELLWLHTYTCILDNVCNALLSRLRSFC